MWECALVFERRPYLQFKIGGSFNRMVLARRLGEGSHVMVSAPVVGSNDTLYVRVIKC